MKPSDVRPPDVERPGNGLWRKDEGAPISHPRQSCAILLADEDSDASTARHKQWLNDPSSQPDLEQWRQTTRRQFMDRPRGVSGIRERGDECGNRADTANG